MSDTATRRSRPRVRRRRRRRPERPPARAVRAPTGSRRGPRRFRTVARASLAAAGLLAALAVARPALALQDEPEQEDRYETVLDLAFTTTSGNQEITLLTTDLAFTHLDPASYRLEAGARARLGRTDGETVAENYRGQVDFAFTPESRWSPFLFAEVEHDPFRRLEVRSNSGSGARYRFWESERGSASISGAVLYSYENFTPDPDLADSLFVPSRQTARLSWRLKGDRELTETFTLEHVTFYQPVWDTLDDYLFDTQTTGRVRVSDAIALTMSYTYARDSTPPPDVGRDDRLFTAGISIEL